MKNWWSDSELKETCGNFHCKYFTMFGCKHPNVKDCQNGSLYWAWDINEEMADYYREQRNSLGIKR